MRKKHESATQGTAPQQGNEQGYADGTDRGTGTPGSVPALPVADEVVKLPLRPGEKREARGPTKKEITARKISESLSKKTKDAIQRLEAVFAMDGTVQEACFYAKISTSTFYNWCKQDPKLLDRLNALRLTPVLKARGEVIKGINGDKHFALRYLEKKRPTEFGDKPAPGISIQRAVIVLPQRNGDPVPAEVLAVEGVHEEVHD